MPNEKGGVNPQRTNPNEAYNRSQFRRQDVLKDREDPQVGPVEDRSRAAGRRHRTGS